MALRSNLRQRIITGTIGAILMVSLIVLSEYTFIFLMAAISMASVNEFNNLIASRTDAKPDRFTSILVTFFSIQVFFLVEKHILPISAYWLIVPVIVLIFISVLYRKSDMPFLDISYTLMGLVYTVLPFLLFIKISYILNNSYSYHLALGIFVILWISDTGAYFAGKTFGKHKLFPRVSPGKTWEGAIGGALFALTASYLISLFWNDLPTWLWVGTAIIIVVFGMYGDLVESSLKRSIQVKDSGSMIPGHGGFLDRFDGLYLSLPVIYSFLQFFY